MRWESSGGAVAERRGGRRRASAGVTGRKPLFEGGREREGQEVALVTANTFPGASGLATAIDADSM